MSDAIKLIIFDLDGTLVNAYPAICASFRYVMEELGLPSVSDEDIIRAVGWGEGKLFEPFIPKNKIAKALDLYRPHHIEALAQHVEFCPGVQELLEELCAQGYTCAVASNRPQQTSLVILKKLEAQEYFTEIVCGDMIGKYKPDPGVLLEILKRCEVGPHAALYVGDMALDVETGKAAGVGTIAVTTGSSSPEEIEAAHPDRMVDQLADVGTILGSWPQILKEN